MRPTPQKLALLMSLAGLGLSLGQSAQAKSEPTVRPNRQASGLEGLMSDGDQPSSAGAELGPVQMPDGPLDVLLPLQQSTVAAVSDEDRAAVALAMVLMAEPWPESTAQALPEFPMPTQHWEVTPEFVRDFRNAASPGELPGSPEATETAKASSSGMQTRQEVSEPRAKDDLVATTARTAAVDLEATVARAHLDLDLDLDLAGGARPISAARPIVAVRSELPPALDLNLDLAATLDLNLDVTSEVDLRLDRPPVFAVTRLKPLGATRAANLARSAAAESMTCTSAEPIVAMAVATSPSPAQMPSPAQAAAPAKNASIAPSASAASVEKAAPQAAPTIVVASHADRVLRSLEVLVANDEPEAMRFGARPQEVFVTSHAEKALLMLASTCAGEEASEPHTDQTPRISKVDLARPAATCKPIAGKARPDRTARRSAIGGEAVALSQGELDKVRGGFETPTGLKISFGIERAVYINGSLVTTTSLNVSDLGKVTGGTAGTVASAVAGSGNLTLIQNGPGNTFQTGPISAATVGTIVQNTLNDQKIQNVTAINATVNSLQIVRAQNLQSTLRGAIIDSLRR